MALLLGLFDRPDALARSTADLVDAAWAYAPLFIVHPSREWLARAAASLDADLAGTWREGRFRRWQLLDGGRAILERSVPVRLPGLGEYRGIAALRARIDTQLRYGDLDERWHIASRRPELALLTAWADGMVVAWKRTRPRIECPDIAADFASGLRVERYLRRFVLAHRRLPSGIRVVGRDLMVDFDALTWPCAPKRRGRRLPPRPGW